MNLFEKARGLFQRRPQRPRRLSRGGFTLLEASLATTIIGVGFLAALTLIAAGTRTNAEGAEQTTGMNLARAIREATLPMSFTAIRALDKTTYSPPVDSRGVTINDLKNWQQKITVTAVTPTQLTQDIVDVNGTACRVKVSVRHNGNKVAEMSWYIFAPATYPP
jgi:Tfp pilus assembly protein PilV